MILLGLDGGGTRTTALVADASGRLLGRGQAGPANYRAVGLDAAVAAIRTAIEEAFTAAGADHDALAAACLGLAGADRPADQAAVRGALAPLRLPPRLLITSDADVALAAGSPTATGVVVIAGTGSIAFGRDPSGRTARAGGWGYLLGDEGSGYWIGREALAALVRAADGRAPATALAPAILRRYQEVSEGLGGHPQPPARKGGALPGPSRLVEAIYGAPDPRLQIAALAPLVTTVAAEGDPIARSILDRAGDALALAAAAVLDHLDFAGPPTVVLAGGVLRNCAPVRDRFHAALAQRHPAAAVVELGAAPAEGAIRLALRLLPCSHFLR